MNHVSRAPGSAPVLPRLGAGISEGTSSRSYVSFGKRGGPQFSPRGVNPGGTEMSLAPYLASL